MRTASPIPYLHAAGVPFVAAFAGVTVLFSLIDTSFFFVGLVLTAWCFYFFRDPKRVTPLRPGLIVSPADGRVVLIQDIVPDSEFGLGDGMRTRVSVFLNVFDVHVNRVPASGTITTRRYRPGKFFNASLDKASVDNERMALTIKLDGDHPKAGESITVVQIAGLIARRILCDAQEGHTVKTGERYGIIRFGSRTDIYLPQGVTPLVSIGQYMIGGETVIADCTSTESARAGECRE